MRPVPLTVLRGGINRLRTKGGARADSLYDLVNGHLTDSGTVKCRSGTRRTATLDSQTRGLCSFDGLLHTFCHTSVTVPDGFVLHILAHPDGTNPALHKIHFASPFLGFLYVVAEFVGGDVFHFWLSSSGTWSANTDYFAGDIVSPSVPAGLQFRAKRLTPANPSWAPHVPRTNGDIIEPTKYNDYYYTVVDTEGDTPASGATEPTWPRATGAEVIEDTEGGSVIAPTSTPLPVSETPPQEVIDRYGQ